MSTRHSSAALYAAIPPATPRTTLGSLGILASPRWVGTSAENLNGLGRRFLDRWRQPGDLVFYQAAPHFFGRDDGGFLRRSRQERPRARLQLPRALGGDDDETVGALLRIVRDGAMR